MTNIKQRRIRCCVCFDVLNGKEKSGTANGEYYCHKHLHLMPEDAVHISVVPMLDPEPCPVCHTDMAGWGVLDQVYHLNEHTLMLQQKVYKLLKDNKFIEVKKK